MGYDEGGFFTPEVQAGRDLYMLQPTLKGGPLEIPLADLIGPQAVGHRHLNESFATGAPLTGSGLDPAAFIAYLHHLIDHLPPPMNLNARLAQTRLLLEQQSRGLHAPLVETNYPENTRVIARQPQFDRGDPQAWHGRVTGPTMPDRRWPGADCEQVEARMTRDLGPCDRYVVEE